MTKLFEIQSKRPYFSFNVMQLLHSKPRGAVAEWGTASEREKIKTKGYQVCPSVWAIFKKKEILVVLAKYNKHVGEMTFGETTWHREQHLLLLGRRLRFHPEQKKS